MCNQEFWVLTIDDLDTNDQMVMCLFTSLELGKAFAEKWRIRTNSRIRSEWEELNDGKWFDCTYRGVNNHRWNVNLECKSINVPFEQLFPERKPVDERIKLIFDILDKSTEESYVALEKHFNVKLKR